MSTKKQSRSPFSDGWQTLTPYIRTFLVNGIPQRIEVLAHICARAEAVIAYVKEITGATHATPSVKFP